MTNTPLDKSNTVHVKRVTVIDEGRDLWEVRGRLLMFLFVLRGTFFKGGAVAAPASSSAFRHGSAHTRHPHYEGVPNQRYHKEQNQLVNRSDEGGGVTIVRTSYVHAASDARALARSCSSIRPHQTETE